jgi:uncharacterized protein
VVHLWQAPDHAHNTLAAFAVSRSVGNSTVRHRVTRRLRAALLPYLESMVGGGHLVIRALPDAAHESSEQLSRDIARALRRLGALDAAPPELASPELDSAGTTRDEETGGALTPRDVRTRGGVARVGWVLGVPVRWLLLSFIWVYRNTVSPILPPTCRYHPSCSAYAWGALQTHGAAKGTVLAIWRVLRCNPFTPGGLDPVPPRGSWRPLIRPDGTPRDAEGDSS